MSGRQSAVICHRLNELVCRHPFGYIACAATQLLGPLPELMQQRPSPKQRGDGKTIPEVFQAFFSADVWKKTVVTQRQK